MDGTIAELGVAGLVCYTVVKEAFGFVKARNGQQGPTISFCDERTRGLRAEIKNVDDSIQRVERLITNGNKKQC